MYAGWRTFVTCALIERGTNYKFAPAGEYILFIDSDDTVLSNTVETFYNRAVEIQSDLVLGNVVFTYENGEQSLLYKRKEEMYRQISLLGEECYVKLMKDNTFPPLVYLYFIKRELIIKNKIFFKEGIIHEDELWCVKAMLSATKVSLIDFYYYNYFRRDGSLMNSNNKEFCIRSLFIVSLIEKCYFLSNKLFNKAICSSLAAISFS